MNLLLGYPVTDEQRQTIAATVPDWAITVAEPWALPDLMFDCDVFCGHARVPLDWSGVVGQGRLKWIQSSAAGLDHCLTDSVRESEIAVSGCAGLFRDSVAEQALALLFGLARGIPRAWQDRQSRQWVRRPTADVHEMRIGIAGFGGNGQRIAELLRPVVARISATDVFAAELRERPEVPAIDRLLPADQLEPMLSTSDAVIVTLPLDAGTRGLFDRAAFRSMPEGAWFVNVGRGGLVDEPALLEAIRSKHLAGAGLDVVATEPLPPDHPFWSTPGIMLTPHVGAQSRTRNAKVTRLFCENLTRFLCGRRLLNLVDKTTGLVAPDDRIPR